MIFNKLEAEWHPTLNLPLIFKSDLPSSKKYWWLGECGHEWDAAMFSRLKGNGCPICSNFRTLRGFNDLATTHPSLVSEWHPSKNGMLRPDQVIGGSAARIWWQCAKGHDWEAPLTRRTRRNSGCPSCSGRNVLMGFNDLVTTDPKLAAEWHPTKNGELVANQVTAGSNKKMWWLGECGHEWEALVNNRANKEVGCPICSGQKVLVGFNDLATIHPNLAAEWHPTKNKILKPSQVNAQAGKKIWWKCNMKHEWEALIYSRSRGKSGCPFCSGHQVLVGFTDLNTINPELAEEWHPSKNGNLAPENIAAHSGKKIWWLGQCNHEWLAILSNRTRGAGCPICSNLKILIGFNDLYSQNSSIASKWHPTKNGLLEPTQVTVGSNKRVWWQCDIGHEWLISIDKIARNDSCPICSNRQLLTGFNDLATRHPELVKEWHPTKNGNRTPTHIIANSSKKVWWHCQSKHNWITTVGSRTRYGSGCPNCANHVSKAEEQIKEFLGSLNLTVETSNRNILKGKELDLYVPAHKVAIEFNGIYWHTEKRRGQTSHYDKWLACKDQGIQLIQIWEDDWNLRSEIIKQTLANRFAPKSNPKTSTVITITNQQAKIFLNESHLIGAAQGDHYLGLTSSGDIDSLSAVVVLNADKDKNELKIVRFASNENPSTDFSILLSHAISELKPASVSAITDNCTLEGEVYENNGFTAIKEIAPDYMYVVKSERKSRAEYPLARFRDDPKLLWEEELTEMDLEDLNGLDRIWDAGKTLYRLPIE